jgi:hypothetical protein
LLDDLTAKVSIDQTSDSSLDGIHESIVTDAVLPRKFCECFGLENSHSASLVPQTIVYRPIYQEKMRAKNAWIVR